MKLFNCYGHVSRKSFIECINSLQCFELTRRCSHIPLYTNFTFWLIMWTLGLFIVNVNWYRNSNGVLTISTFAIVRHGRVKFYQTLVVSLLSQQVMPSFWCRPLQYASCTVLNRRVIVFHELILSKSDCDWRLSDITTAQNNNLQHEKYSPFCSNLYLIYLMYLMTDFEINVCLHVTPPSPCSSKLLSK